MWLRFDTEAEAAREVAKDLFLNFDTDAAARTFHEKTMAAYYPERSTELGDLHNAERGTAPGRPLDWHRRRGLRWKTTRVIRVHPHSDGLGGGVARLTVRAAGVVTTTAQAARAALKVGERVSVGDWIVRVGDKPLRMLLAMEETVVSVPTRADLDAFAVEIDRARLAAGLQVGDVQLARPRSLGVGDDVRLTRAELPARALATLAAIEAPPGARTREASR